MLASSTCHWEKPVWLQKRHLQPRHLNCSRICRSPCTRWLHRKCMCYWSIKSIRWSQPWCLIYYELIEILENIFHCCHSFDKWNKAWSSVIEISLGVRQGSAPSPFLFAVYLDDLSKTCSLTSDCSIILYADDILLLSLSVTRLEQLLHACECELTC